MSESKKRYTGGCLCGALRYEAHGVPIAAGYCYCADCRKASGSGFIPFMGFSAKSVRFMGQAKQFVSKAANGGEAVRNSCPVCSSLVFGGVVGESDSFTIYVGSLDDPSLFEPKMAIFNRSRPNGCLCRRVSKCLKRCPEDKARPEEGAMSKSNPEISVTISRDGPYIVTGGVPLATQTIIADGEGGSEAWAEGDPYPAPQRYALCRCGRSGKKPFCDGTPIKIGFDGSETASRATYLDQARMFDGPSLALSDNERLCAFGRFCDSHGKVWNQVERNGDPRRRQQFLRQVANCPAGRLVAWDKAKGTAIEPALPISIGLVEDPVQVCSGPLWLRGGIVVISSDGFRYEVRNRVTVCRCGASQNRPFCDSTHAAIGFKAD